MLLYLNKDSHAWQVSGVVDMECVSAGYCGADWLKLMIEMAGYFPASTTWWEYMFEGYGSQPDYDLIKLDNLIADEIGLRVHTWPGTREEIAWHLLSARCWRELFDLSRI